MSLLTILTVNMHRHLPWSIVGESNYSFCIIVRVSYTMLDAQQVMYLDLSSSQM